MPGRRTLAGILVATYWFMPTRWDRVSPGWRRARIQFLTEMYLVEVSVPAFTRPRDP